MSAATASGARERVRYYDRLRVVSMIFVVALHASASALRTEAPGYGWHAVNAFTSLATAAVPLFFMLSGALLLSDERTLSIRYTLKVRLPRLLVPLAAWSLVSVAREFCTTYLTGGGCDFATLKASLAGFFVQPVTVHLWFLYALIPLYLIAPAIKVFTDAAPRKLLRYALALWALGSAVQTVRLLLPASVQYNVTLSFVEKLGFVGGWLGYFLLGYALSTTKLRLKPLYCGTAAAVLTAVIALGTLVMTRARGYYDESFKTYTTLWVMALATALFLLARELDRAPRFPALLRFMSDISFGVYLSHNIVIAVLATLGLYGESLSITLVCFAAALAISAAVSAAAYMIPGVSYVLTGRSVKRKK